MNTSRRDNILLGVSLLLIVGLGAYLRFFNLRANPGWYPDEGSVLNVAWNFWHGRLQYFAIGGSLLVSARAPLFPLILAGLFDRFGYDILVPRVITAAAGVITIPLLYFCLKRTIGRPAALAVSAIFAGLPLAVLYSRWSFEYSLLMPLSILLLWSFLKLVETAQARWMLMGSVIIALSILIAMASVSLLLCFITVGLFTNRRALFWAVPLALAAPAAYLLYSYSQAPEAFIQDLTLTLSRTEAPFLAQFVYAAGNYAVFVSSNYWFALSIVGIFLIRPRHFSALVGLLYFVQLFFILRFAQVGEFGFYRVLAIVPLMAISLYAFLARGFEIVSRWFSEGLDYLASRLDEGMRWWPRVRPALRTVLVPLFIWFIVVDVLAFTVLTEVVSMGTEFRTDIAEVLAFPEADAQAAIDFVNRSAEPSEVVLASPQIGWAINAQVADFQQTLSYQGLATDNYPIPVRRERFLFNPLPQNAKYAVVDRMWREWGPRTIPGMSELVNDVSAWPVAFQASDFVVYRNPAK